MRSVRPTPPTFCSGHSGRAVFAWLAVPRLDLFSIAAFGLVVEDFSVLLAVLVGVRVKGEIRPMVLPLTVVFDRRLRSQAEKARWLNSVLGASDVSASNARMRLRLPACS